MFGARGIARSVPDEPEEIHVSTASTVITPNVEVWSSETTEGKERDENIEN